MKLNVSRFEKFVREKGEKKDMTDLNITFLDARLAVFLKSLRKLDGEEYELVTVQGYSNSIRKYLGKTWPMFTKKTHFHLPRVH